VLVTDVPAPVLVRVAGAMHLVEAPSVQVMDTVGAGETFGGAFLACVLEMGLGRDGLGDVEAVLTAARFAVRTSGLVCGRVGADPPNARRAGWLARSRCRGWRHAAARHSRLGQHRPPAWLTHEQITE
jgi:fructokinase